MGIRYKIRKAQRIVQSLQGPERSDFNGVCRTLQEAEKRFQDDGAPLFQKCIDKCRGLCCKNVNADDLITLLDFVFILGASRFSAEELIPLAEGEPVFTADCMFLKDGSGPCLFPEDVRPERCILSFCSQDDPVRGALGRVRQGFSRLNRFLLLRRPALMLSPW